jgi:rhamnogalacturonyl hydrolase YesR
VLHATRNALPGLLPEVRAALSGLEGFVARNGFKGWDPYDALNSPFLRGLSLGLKYPRIAFTQALKLLPLNLRPVLGIRPSYNPKGLGLFLAGTLRRFRLTGDERYAATACWLTDKLLDLRSAGHGGAGWGYPFPWQSRAFFVPRWTPTIVNTSFVAHALLDAAELLGDERCFDAARSACSFILLDLHRTELDGAHCFSYTPRDRLCVHNANMLGAALLARVGARTGEDELLVAARGATAYLLRHQQEDGAWWYAEPEYQHWIDSFHTGFCLVALRQVLRYAGMEEAQAALVRGHRFFLRNFFERDGTPRYYHDRREPLDVHCPAQAFVTICELWDTEPAPQLLAQVARWFLGRMRSAEGYFFYRLGRLGPNRIPYLRWSQAWAYHGLTRLEVFLEETAAGAPDRPERGWAPGRPPTDPSREGVALPEQTERQERA